MVTDEQVRKLRLRMSQGMKQEAAAAVAGMSERSARKWQRGSLPSERKPERTWRTRPDPFGAAWESDVVPLLKADGKGVLQAHTILRELQSRHPDTFVDGQVRTLQRRMRDWRAAYGPEKEVFFQQEHVPGREGAFDFTHGTELGVTVGGKVLAHLLFQMVFSFSKWVYACVAFGETFEAMVAGLQEGLWRAGGVPAQLRHDNLSAATHELKRSGGRALNARFQAVVEHYDTQSSRINPGESNENGVVEKRNHLTKTLLDQQLVLRGSREFVSVEAYERFVAEAIEQHHNCHVMDKLAVERQHLKPLPSCRIPEYTTYKPKVTKWSTVLVAKRPYSVPSRLMGHWVEARQYPDVVEVWHLGKCVESMPRVREENGSCINYRHIIWSLVRKPGAFAHYRYREALFPTLTFRRAYDDLRARTQRADVEYVRILHLAASTMETEVEVALEELLHKGEAFDYAAVQKIAQPRPPTVPAVNIPAVDLAVYDQLLGGMS